MQRLAKIAASTRNRRCLLTLSVPSGSLAGHEADELHRRPELTPAMATPIARRAANDDRPQGAQDGARTDPHHAPG